MLSDIIYHSHSKIIQSDSDIEESKDLELCKTSSFFNDKEDPE